MVLEEPRNAEKFARKSRAAIRSVSKDMMGLERGGFWRGNGGRCCIDTPRGQHAASWVKQFACRKGSFLVVEKPNV